MHATDRSGRGSYYLGVFQIALRCRACALHDRCSQIPDPDLSGQRILDLEMSGPRISDLENRSGIAVDPDPDPVPDLDARSLRNFLFARIGSAFVFF